MADSEAQAHALIYQSRMRILKNRPASEKKAQRTAIERGGLAKEPCRVEDLVPTLMPRSKAFRYARWERNQDSVRRGIPRLASFSQMLDPETTRRREEIFARIRAAEMQKQQEQRARERALEKRRQSTIVPRMPIKSNQSASQRSDNTSEIASDNPKTEDMNEKRAQKLKSCASEPAMKFNTPNSLSRFKNLTLDVTSSLDEEAEIANDEDLVSYPSGFEFLEEFSKQDDQKNRPGSRRMVR